MAASLYIVVEGEDPGFDTFVNGQVLARNEDAIEHLCTELNVPSLLDFFSADQNSMALLIQEGGGNPALLDQLPTAQWRAPADGLRTVAALVLALSEDPRRLGAKAENDGPLALAELREYETVLRKTATRNLRWHLAVSWR